MGLMMDGLEKDRDEWREEAMKLRRALKNIDAVATQKKAGAAVKMQRIARDALALPNGER